MKRARAAGGLRCFLVVLGGVIAAIPPTSARSQRKGDRAFGEYLSTECVTCHQISGKATGGIPAIVAWPEDQFVAVLQSYKMKERENNVMQTIAGRLSQDEIESLAAYFGGLSDQTARN